MLFVYCVIVVACWFGLLCVVVVVVVRVLLLLCCVCCNSLSLLFVSVVVGCRLPLSFFSFLKVVSFVCVFLLFDACCC